MFSLDWACNAPLWSGDPRKDHAEILRAIEKACVQFDSGRVKDLLEATIAGAGLLPQYDIVDPVWIRLATGDRMAALTSIPSNVTEIPAKPPAIN